MTEGKQPHEQSPGTTIRVGETEPADWRRYLRLTVYGLLVVFTGVFLMLNSAETTVNMVFFEATLPLFLVLFGALVMGALLGAGALFIIYRLREKEARRRAEREQAKRSGKKGKGPGGQDGGA